MLSFNAMMMANKQLQVYTHKPPPCIFVAIFKQLTDWAHSIMIVPYKIPLVWQNVILHKTLQQL